MTVSDSSPIQFWPTGDESYNEKAICGVYTECFCQPFNCADLINVPLSSESGGQYELRVIDEDSNVIDTDDFAEISTGKYLASFSLESFLGTYQSLIAPSSYTDYSSTWTGKNTTTFTKSVSAGTPAVFSYQAVSFPVARKVTISYNVNVTGSWSSGSLGVRFYFADSAFSEVSTQTNPTAISVAGSYDYEIEFTVPSTAVYLFVTYAGSISGGGANAFVTVTPELGTFSDCILNPQFKIFDVTTVGALAGFTNKDRNVSGASPTAGASWTLSSNPSIVLGGTNASDYLIDNFPSVANQEYSFDYQANFGTNGATLKIFLLDANYNIVGVSASIYYASGVNSGTETITPTANGAYIACGVLNGGVANTFTMQILEKSSPSEIEIFHSDCIDIKDDHECTSLIQYSNSVNFDGLDFESGSPSGQLFYLRVPAQFWKEDNPQEQEDHELSSGQIVVLRQRIEEKRLLEVGYMPNHMHKKIQKILMMDSIYIDGLYWRRRDAYESPNINRYGLKKGQVWLTKYDSVKKNTP